MPGKTVLELPPRRGNPRNSEGAFITLHDGRLLFVYSKFIAGRMDDSPAVIAARVSRDGGRSWSARDRILLRDEGAQNMMSVSLLRLQDGRIALFYVLKHGFHDSRLVMRTSTDEGRTWSNPILTIPAPGYFVVNNDRVIQLRDGRLIVPAAYHRRKLDTLTDVRGFDFRGIAMFFLSDDGGRSWREAHDWWALPVASQAGLQEPGLIELSDGRLFAWCRTDQGCQYGMTSHDGGETWSPPAPTPFHSPVSPLSIKRIPATGDLLAVWNDHSGRFRVPPPRTHIHNWGRTPLVAAISRDEGESWHHHTLIERDPLRGYSYTAIYFPDDSHVLLAYCAGGKPTGYVLNTLRIRRLTLASLYRGGN